ncbi:7041_t:CDS:2, partial [Cetraspora pellucida]
KHEQRAYRELITEPVIFTPDYNQVINHSALPAVKDELSITLNINVLSHGPDDLGWHMVFYKGRTEASRTPALWLKPSDSTPCLRLSITDNFTIGIDMDGYGLLLNRWYHIAYTLSDSEKRIYFYIDGKWVGSFSLKNPQIESIIFNDGPLYIGDHLGWNGITGKISNFRYYNFRLSHKEVLMDYSGKDPTKLIDDKCPNKFFDGLGIGFFFSMIALLVSCQKQEKRAYRELITEPVKINYDDRRVISHSVLPVVKDELSITLKIKLSNLCSDDFCRVFYKGDDETPKLLLKSSNSTLCPRLSITDNSNTGIDIDGYDGKWVGSFSLKNIQSQSIRFNDGPLYIGYNPKGWPGITGDIREVLMDYLVRFLLIDIHTFASNHLSSRTITVFREFS